VSFNLVYKDNRFWPLFWTQFLGAFNDNFFKNALVILITYKSISLFGLNSPSLVAMAGGIFIIPFFLFSATAGQIADKYDKSTVLKLTKVSELVIMSLVGVGLYTNNFLLLMIVLFLMGAQSAFFGPLKYGIIPNLVNKDEIVTANSFVASSTFVSILLGTIAGGVFATIESALPVLSVSVVLIAIIGILVSLKVKHTDSGDKKIKVNYFLIPPMWPILKVTMMNKKIFQTILGVSWFWLVGAAILALLPPLVKDIFYGSGEVATLFLATFTIGMGLGGVLCEKISRKRVEVGIVPIAAVIMSFFLFDLGYVGFTWNGVVPITLLDISSFLQQDNAIRALIDLLIVSTFGGLFIIPQMSFIQYNCKKEYLARTIAGNNIWNALGMVMGAGAIILFNKKGYSPAEIFIIIAGANFILSFVFFAIRSAETWRFIFDCFCHIFYDMEVEGEENIPEEGPVILCMNHVSYLDWLMVMAISKKPVRFVIDYVFYYIPTGPFWFKQAGLIPIATTRESPKILEEAYSRISKALAQGDTLGLFPEGFISRNGQMRRFQPGVSKILKKNPTTVVPIAMEGMWGSIFSFSGAGPLKKLPSLKRRKLKIKILEPIAPENFSLHDLEDKIHAHMSIKSLVIEERKSSGIRQS
jgi:1-acyl-sn-glycerol-3-phosphate acyltransferase